MIHALPELAAVADTNIESARDALIEQAARLLEPGIRVSVVFDGQGPMTDIEPALPGVDGLDAVYTAHTLSADSWIERTVYRAKNRDLCTVITADGGIRDLCRGLGARVFTPDWFEGEAGRNRSGAAHGHRPGHATGELGEHLDPASQERLSQLRDKLGRQNDSEGKP